VLILAGIGFVETFAAVEPASFVADSPVAAVPVDIPLAVPIAAAAVVVDL